MRKEIFDLIKRELQYIGLLFALVFAVFKIAFYKQDFLTILRTVVSIFYLFGLPGYSIMLYWHDKLGFFERFIIGAMLAAGIIGTLSYYLGLLGINIRHHSFLLPVMLILTGFFAAAKSP